ncbi:ABC transporter ATP-binding protein [Pseudonocardia sp. NPDC049154]|uniref:ABC transporter ATP-binding protein n=1 Tax=Pseudonocardia sp. NPDC049154 TaxID=3155501 RepID=UPI0033F21AC3
MSGSAAETTAAPAAPTRLAAVRAEGLEMTFGVGERAVHALGPLDLEVGEGEFVCLVGPSGCGKSTFVKIAAGLLEPTAGRMRLRFRDDTVARTATVFQDYGIFPWKTVEGNVQLALRARGIPAQEARERSRVWLRKLGLEAFARSYPHQLSGGMRQRVAIARALVVEPELLLMDEPFAALDAQLREILQEELLALHQSTGGTVVFVTHSLEEAILLGDRVVVMSRRPGTIRDDTVVPFPRPRASDLRETAEFGALRSRLWDHLRREVTAQIAGTEAR